jgi:hypothetical protein
MGETICLSSHEPEPPARLEMIHGVISLAAPVRVIDEDPERWDGLS